MSFVNKEIRFDKFMEQLRQRIERGGNIAALIFFGSFLQRALPEELRRAAVADWDGHTVSAGDFDVLYPLAVRILHDAATRNASEVHPDTYKEANAVSSAFCEELNELFQCSGEEVFGFIPIKSYSQMMAEAGLVDLSHGPDGQTMVSLSDEGKRVAREVEDEIRPPHERN